MSQKPIYKKQEGCVSAAVFDREQKMEDGKSFTSYSVALQVSYKNKKGEWIRNSLTIVKSDLKKVLEVLHSAEKNLCPQVTPKPQ